jgi:hypothetical protein
MSRNRQSLLESKSILSLKPIKPFKKSTIRTNSLKKKPIARVGETGNFAVDYDSNERLILIYGKEAPTSHGFKLGLDKEETKGIINLLKQAKTLFPQ